MTKTTNVAESSARPRRSTTRDDRAQGAEDADLVGTRQSQDVSRPTPSVRHEGDDYVSEWDPRLDVIGGVTMHVFHGLSMRFKRDRNAPGREWIKRDRTVAGRVSPHASGER